MKATSFFTILFLMFFSTSFGTTLIVNSLDYKDIISSAILAKYNNYTFLFALTPNQSVFITKYYTLNKDEPIIYIEGKNTVLANMGSLLKEANLKNLSIFKPPIIYFWVADQLKSKEAIIVGSAYGQDALAVSSYAALSGTPILFFDSAKEQEFISGVLTRNYSKLIIYGKVVSSLSEDFLGALGNKEIIDTGNRYSNNIEITKKFLSIEPARQAIFVSGYSFEKSMIDKKFPILLVGQSTVPSFFVDFLKEQNLTSGVVFSGDANIVDGINYLKAQIPEAEFFIKFGEGYRGSTQPLPLAIIPLPSPNFKLEILNISYLPQLKIFELKIRNSGDLVFLAAAISVEDLGSGQSSQVMLEPNKTTSLAIPLDATSKISNNKIKSATLTVLYGEDVGLMDNIELLTINDIIVSDYSDNSTLRVMGLEYDSTNKQFVLTVDGKGWVEGTISFNINNKLIVLGVPLSKINGITKIPIKYFLSSQQELYVNKLESNYLLRYGAEKEILLKEKRGQNLIYTQSKSFLPIQQLVLYGSILLGILFFLFFASKFFKHRERDWFG
ncbi:MAG: cell wall-binding repeat-containing protein [Candidatus Anstonellaceae archaeon]